MAQDATSTSTTQDPAAASATDDDTAAQQLLADADTQPDNGPAAADKTAAGKDDDADRLGDAGKRALAAERKARRDAEKQLGDFRSRLQEFEDRDKTELQRATDRAEQAEKAATDMRTANARLMAAAVHSIPPDLIEFLGSGTDEEIDQRAATLAAALQATTPAAPTPPEPSKAPAAPTRPVEALTPGAQPANATESSMDDVLRRWAGRKS